jgi:hypothetical protein
MTRTNYYVNSRKQNSWRYTCRPSSYHLYLLNLLSHRRQGWVYGSEPYTSCPSISLRYSYIRYRNISLWVGCLRLTFTRHSASYSPNIYYNNIRSCFALLEPRPCLIPSVTKGSTAQSPCWYFQLSLIQHHLLISVLDSSPLGRLLRRRQFTSTFSEQIDLAHPSFRWWFPPSKMNLTIHLKAWLRKYPSGVSTNWEGFSARWHRSALSCT